VIVVDASVLIAHLDERDALHAQAVDQLLAVAEQPLACSSITLAEVLVGPARAGRLDEARAALTTLGVREVSLGPDASARLAALRAETGLKLPDCCVLLAAEEVRTTGVLTFDDHLAREAGRLGFG
jgi:predicted nucleic acid-binding protein